MRISDWSSDVCSSDLYVAPGISVIRTGTGDLSLTAAGDIRMSSLYGIYTAGTATDPGDGYDLRRGTLPTGVVLGGDTDYSATLASYQDRKSTRLNSSH